MVQLALSNYVNKIFNSIQKSKISFYQAIHQKLYKGTAPVANMFSSFWETSNSDRIKNHVFYNKLPESS